MFFVEKWKKERRTSEGEGREMKGREEEGEGMEMKGREGGKGWRWEGGRRRDGG